MSNSAALDQLLAELARFRIGATFNQYAEAGPDDAPDAPAIRLENLRAYLADAMPGLPAALDKPARAGPVNGWLCRGVICLPPIGDFRDGHAGQKIC